MKPQHFPLLSALLPMLFMSSALAKEVRHVEIDPLSLHCKSETSLMAYGMQLLRYDTAALPAAAVPGLSPGHRDFTQTERVFNATTNPAPSLCKKVLRILKERAQNQAISGVALPATLTLETKSNFNPYLEQNINREVATVDFGNGIVLVSSVRIP